MHLERACEIVEAERNIKVLYENNPVWIENINQENSTAHVRILGYNKMLEVPVSLLNEDGKKGYL